MTPLSCFFLGHAPSRMIIANSGYRFSHCRRCGREIVQSVVSGWREPEKGFRIVWRFEQRARASNVSTCAPLPAPETTSTVAPQIAREKLAFAARISSADFMGADDKGFDWLSETPAEHDDGLSGTRGVTHLSTNRI